MLLEAPRMDGAIAAGRDTEKDKGMVPKTFQWVHCKTIY